MRNFLLLTVLLSTSFQFLLAQSNIKSHHVNKDIRFSEDESIQNNFYKSEKENFSSKSSEYGETPGWNWESQFGGSDSDYGRDIVTDSNGNIYVVGSFCGEIQIGSETFTSTGEREAIIAKFDNTGNVVWSEIIEAETDKETDAFGICIDSLDNIYVTGYYTGSVTLGTTNLPDIAEYNLFLTKLNSSGDILLAVNNGDVEEIRVGLKLDIDKEGNIYIVGATDDRMVWDAWRHEVIILKYDKFGNLIWEQEHDESINDIRCGKKHFYLIGSLEKNHDGIIDDDVSIVVTGQYGDAFILKSDFDGDYKWAAISNHTSYNTGLGVAEYLDIDEEENIYMAGYFSSNIVFGSNTLIGSLYTGYVAKCDSSGQFLWAHSVDGRSTEDVSVGNNDKVYVLSDYIYEFTENGSYIRSPDEVDVECLNTCSNGDIVLSGSNNNLIYVFQLNNVNEVEWTSQLNGNSGYATILGMVADSTGNVYTYGYTSNKLDYYNTTVEKGLFVSKQNKSGEVIWINELHGNKLSLNLGSYIEIDPSNENIFIAGEFTETLVIPDENTLIPAEGGSIFLVKYSVNGTYKWALQEDFASNKLCLSADYSGNIICSGIYAGSINISGTTHFDNGLGNVFITKYDVDGNLSWTKSAGGDDIEYVGLVSVDGNNNIYFTGEFTSENVTINETSITLEEGDGNIIYSKLNSEGAVQWIKSFAGSEVNDGSCWPTGIKTDKLGNSYIKGWHGDSTSFGNITLYSPYHNESYFIIKTDPEGTVLWANSITEHMYGFDYNQMDIDKNGSVYLGAEIRDTIHFGDEFQYDIDYWAGRKALFVAKYSTYGYLDWVRIMDCRDGRFSSVAVWDTSNVFIGGHFIGDISLGDNVFLSKTKHGFIALTGNEAVGIKEVYNSADNKIIVYPNPSDDIVYINLPDKEINNINIQVYDLSGKIVLTKFYNNTEEITISKAEVQNSGMYLIKINNNYSGKIIFK